MGNGVILYEYPFNERIRTYLRLEHLFRRLGTLVPRQQPIDHHYALATLFEIMDVGARADLKSDVMKDLEKQKQQLNSYRGNPAISERALDEVIRQLDACFAALNSQPGRAGSSLTENEWLMSIKQRTTIPGGLCEFDLPAYHYWLHLPPEQQRRDIETWLAPFLTIRDPVDIVLRLLRASGKSSPAGSR